MAQQKKLAIDVPDEKRGIKACIAIGGAALTLTALLASCGQSPSNQKVSQGNAGSGSDQGKDGLVALKCTVNGSEKNVIDGMEEKPITKEDVFIFDAKASRLMSGEFSPLDAEINDEKIIIDTKKEDVNALDGTGSSSEYFYAIDRASLAATHTRKAVVNLGGIQNSTYVVAEGSCEKISIPEKKAVERNNQI